VLGIVITSVFSRNLDDQLAMLKLPPQIHQQIEMQQEKLAGIAIPKEVNNQMREAIKRAINEAYINGFRTVMLLCVGLALLSAITAWLMVKDISKPKT
jgi:hypothetical protein